MISTETVTATVHDAPTWLRPIRPPGARPWLKIYRNERRGERGDATGHQKEPISAAVRCV